MRLLGFIFVLLQLTLPPLGWAHDSTGVELVDLVDCEVLLSLRSYRLKIRAGRRNLAVEVPELFNAPVSTITYSFEMILKGLGMNQAEFQSTFQGKNVLLVGEGFGELLPNLIAAGAQTKAIDPLYALADIEEAQWNLDVLSDRPQALQTFRQIKHYLNVYEDALSPGLSTALPYANESFDFVISHFLLSNFITRTQERSEQLKVMRLNQLTILESARVLRPGGRAIHILAGDKGNRKRKYLEEILSPRALAPLRPLLQIQFEIKGPTILPVDYRDHQDFDDTEVNAWSISVTRQEH